MIRQAANPSVTGNFWVFFKEWRGLIMGMMGVAALPCLVELLTFLGPPWPGRDQTILLTTIANWVVLLFTFTYLYRAQIGRIKRKVGLLTSLTVIGLVLYMGVVAFFVYDAPDPSARETAGLWPSSNTRVLLKTMKGATVWNFVNKFGYNPLQVWEPWTVHFMRFALLLLWLASFACLSSLTAAFVLLNEAHARSATRPLFGRVTTGRRKK